MTGLALPPLRVLFCGSVDDGKSTLIGRLLSDAALIPDDQRATLVGPDGLPDFSRLTDGLADERAQGITIDVAWRYVTTPRRRLMIADAPGHEQYTRNMATAASQVDAAVVLLDVTRGVLPQTRRHAVILSVFGVRHIVLAVNKMDRAGHDAAAFRDAAAGFADAVRPLGFLSVMAIPVVARDGDMVVRRGENLGFHDGPTLLESLETLDAAPAVAAKGFRMPVQLVLRPLDGPRLYAGTVSSGAVRPDDALAGGARVARIVTFDGDRAHAVAGDAVALALDDERDVARGDVLAADPAPERATRVEARLVWLADRPLLPGRGHLFRFGTRTVPGAIVRVHGQFDPLAMQTAPIDDIGANVIVDVTIALSEPVSLDAFESDPALGGMIVIDRDSAETLAAGVVTRVSPPSGDVVWQTTALDRAARAAIKGQRASVVWFTGLPGAGKSTIADLVERRLHAAGRHTAMLDGDNLRHGLCRDLGFSEADRVENIRRAAEVARLMADAGLIVLVALVSPYRADRDSARVLFAADEFFEVFVDTPVGECRRRDPKGLYARGVKNLSGVDAPYEPPLAPELRLATVEHDAETLADRVLETLARAERPR